MKTSNLAFVSVSMAWISGFILGIASTLDNSSITTIDIAVIITGFLIHILAVLITKKISDKPDSKEEVSKE